MSNDPISPEIRAIEKEIDSFYLRNPIVQLPFASACWYYLVYFEDIPFLKMISSQSFQVYEQAAHLDNHIFDMQYPVRWLFNSCPPGGKPPLQRQDENYFLAAHELAMIGHEYDYFCAAFTLASRNLIQLELRGSELYPVSFYNNDLRYDAYDLLLKPTNQLSKLPDFYSIGEMNDLVSKVLTVSKETFTYSRTKRLINSSMRILSPIFNSLLELPDHWQFPNYSIKEFRMMYRVLFSMAFIHSVARINAAKSGCEGGGVRNCVIVIPKTEFTYFIAEFANVYYRTAAHFVDDLTFGNRSIRTPDPAIQPLILLNDTLLGIAPYLIIGNSLERNFTILLNKLPLEKSIYLNLVSEKENVMRQRIKHDLRGKDYRFYNGKIPVDRLPDIDLAIICDKEKVIQFLELKWFTAPAEVREVVEKGEEIRKGVSQLLSLSQAFRDSSKQFYDVLGIDSSYRAYFILVSKNYIGEDRDQHPDIPVIQIDHFLRKAHKSEGIEKFSEWISKREFLPIEGRDFEVVSIKSSIGQWGLVWRGIQPLLSDEFDP